jgi:hypothetical protein
MSSETIIHTVPASLLGPTKVELPAHVVSDIVSISNSADDKSAVIVSVHPESGSQVIEINPVRLQKFQDIVKDAVILLHQHRRCFKLINKQVDVRVDDDLEEDEYIDDPDYFKQLIDGFAEQDPEITELVKLSAYDYYGIVNTDCLSLDPISEAFLHKAYELAEHMSSLLAPTREKYLSAVIDNVHKTNPELDADMYTFIRFYTYKNNLLRQAKENLSIESILMLAHDNTNLNYYEPVIGYCRTYILDILECAKKSKEDRKIWLNTVLGKMK